MIIEILMPALSPTMTEGNLAKWYKKEGEKVKAGEIIAEIETDKATMEVEAVDEGIIGKLLVEAGTSSVKVGTAIALVLEEDSDKELLLEYKVKSQEIKKEEKSLEVKSESQISVVNEIGKQDRVFASPLAKRIAQQNSVNLSRVVGSGPHGRIVKADVEKSMTSSEKKIISIGGYDLEPVSNMRKVIAKRLLESKLTVPHFYLNIDCNLDSLLGIREQINSDLEKDKRISVNDFIIKASAMAMMKNPDVNSSWSDDGIMKYRDIDISVAVAIDGGLVTPIIKSANYKTIFEISMEMKQLAKKAKEGKLMPEEYQGGGFSISNLGMFGIKQFAAIINPPQSSILAVGAGNKVPVVKNDKIEIATIAEMTLSCDHRVVDGAVGARFLSSLKDYLEKPAKLLI